jgi:WD40 repeat protein
MTSASRPPDPIFTLRGSGCPITCLKFSDQWLFSGSEDGTVHIWDLRTHRPVDTLQAHPGSSVLWIEFVSNDQMVTYGKNGVANVWRATESTWKCTGNMASESTFTKFLRLIWIKL